MTNKRRMTKVKAQEDRIMAKCTEGCAVREIADALSLEAID